MNNNSARLTNLQPPDEYSANVLMVVETPRGNRAKFKYDAALEIFHLHKLLPLGTAFPFHFGFVPATRGEDGDFIDILLLLDEPLPQGCIVEARVVGAIEAMQYAPDQPPQRNDRIIAVAAASEEHNAWQSLDDLDSVLIANIEQFFVNYNLAEGKKFNPIGRADAKSAKALIQSAADAFAATQDVAHI